MSDEDMQTSSSGKQIMRTISRAAFSIRDGLNDYLGIDANSSSNESYYVQRDHADQPYWMQDNFWGDQQNMNSVAVVPSNYEEPPPPYIDAPPVHVASNQYYTVGVSEMSPMGSPNLHPVDSYEKTLAPSSPSSRGKPRGRGRGRGDRSGRGRGRGGVPDKRKGDQKRKRAAPPPTYKPFFIMATTAIDLVLLIWEIILNGGLEPWSVNPWFGPSSSILIDVGAKYAPFIRLGEGWRFVTPIFLHVGIGHFVLNMLTQLRVGVTLEKTYGPHRIIPIYMLCGVFGNLMSAVMLPTSVQVGASGALFGFTGVLFADLLQNWSLIESPWKNLISLIFSSIISFMVGLLLPGVDNFAHIGGLIMGVLTGFVFLPSLNPARGVKKGRLFTVIVSFITLVVLFIAMFVIFYRNISTNDWCPGCQYITCLPNLSWCKTT